MIIKFRIPLIKTRNEWESMNRWEKTKFKDDLNADVCKEIRRHFKTAIPQFRHAKIKYTLHTKRMADGDSIVEMQALITNAIKYTGIIPDDSPLYLDETSIAYVKDDDRYVDVKLETKGEGK